MSADRVVVAVAGRRLGLSNLEKVLYPEVGFTKGAVIDYYSRIAPVLLPHLRDRPLTLKRYPDGVTATPFFQKNVPANAPPWVRRVRLPTPGSSRGRETIDFTLLDDLPGLVWAANLGTLELHTPMWRVAGDGAQRDPDLLVVDLDPGPPADVLTCSRVALLLRDRLAEDDLIGYPKTSGSKGLQLYVPLAGDRPWAEVSGYARRLAGELERGYPHLVVSSMRKDIRGGKVLLDWSQNNAAKTTVTVYSLRARDAPTVSTPVTWAEVESARTVRDLVFTSEQVLDRVEADGDLFAGILDGGRTLPGR